MFRSIVKGFAIYYVAQAIVGIVIGLYVGFTYPDKVMELINAAY